MDLLSSFMQSSSTWVVAEARPHLVYLLSHNKIKVSNLKITSSACTDLKFYLRCSSIEILHCGPPLEWEISGIYFTLQNVLEIKYKSLKCPPSSICCNSLSLWQLGSVAALFLKPTLKKKSKEQIYSSTFIVIKEHIVHTFLEYVFCLSLNAFHTCICPDVNVWFCHSLQKTCRESGRTTCRL